MSSLQIGLSNWNQSLCLEGGMHKYLNVFILAFVFSMIPFPTARAQEVNQCVHYDSKRGLTNTCAFPVEVIYCEEQDCARNNLSQWTIRAGSTFGFTAGNRRVYYGACRGANSVTSRRFTGGNLAFGCE